MTVAGMTTIHAFPLDVRCVLDLLPRVNALVLWFDLPHVNRRAEFEQLIATHGQHLQHVVYLQSDVPWKPSTFREPQLRALDDLRPGYVLQPDSDETFGLGFEDDFNRFRRSGQDMMLFSYDMPTIDGAWVPTQPKSRHCKAFRWLPGLSFRPYRGHAKPTGLTTEFAACSRIQHYCCYTPELQQAMLQKQTMPASQRAYWGQRIKPCSTA
jgi:hypothetical protein